MAQLEGSEFDFSDLFVSPAISPSGMFGVVPGYDPSASDFFGPNVQRFIEILKGYFEDQDQDDIDRILRQGQVQKFIEVLRRFESGDATLKDLQQVDVSDLVEIEEFEDYYNDIVIVQAPTDYESIYKILKGAGYSDEAIDEIEKASVDNGKFKGNNVLATILRDLGYEADNWEVQPIKNVGDACRNADGPGTIANNGECVTDTSEGTPCYIGSGTIDQKEGKRDANGDCIISDGPDCKVITQENADECGYEITSDGQLVPKDLSGDPDSYINPTYVNCGGGIFAETINDCPDMEGTGSQIPEDQTKTSQAIKDWIEGQIGKVKDLTVDDVLETVFGGNDWDPLCKDEPGDIWDCNGKDGTTGKKCWKDCVSASVLGGIPGLPMPPGNIDIGTVRDLENKVEEIGGTISDIFSAPQGDADDEGFIQRAKDWVLGKIDDIFGNIDDVTPGQITDWITGVLGTTIAGVILKEIEGKKNSVIDKINQITGLPIAPTDDENCKEIEYFEANKEKCTALGYVDCDTLTEEDGTELTGGIQKGQQNCSEVVDPNVDENGCTDGTWNENMQQCMCPDGVTPEDVDGKCADDVVDPEVDPNGSGPDAEEICKQKGLVFEPNTQAPGRDEDGCVSTVIADPTCDDPNAQGYGEIGECGECNENFKKDPNTGKCIPDDTTGTDCSTITSENADKCGKTDCGGGVFVDKGKQCPGGTGCPKGQKKFDGENCEDVCPDDPSIPASNSACQSTTGCKPKGEVLESGCDGSTFFIRFADGECGEIYDSVPNYAGCGGGYKCNDPKATNYGEEGECKYGPVVDPCLDSAYAEANPTICGTDPECNDCTCAEYAAANPEECGTGGGGGGGGGAGGSSFGSGMFEMTPTDITAAPELLAAAQFPIVDCLSDALPKNVKSNVMKGLFEGLV